MRFSGALKKPITHSVSTALMLHGRHTATGLQRQAGSKQQALTSSSTHAHLVLTGLRNYTHRLQLQRISARSQAAPAGHRSRPPCWGQLVHIARLRLLHQVPAALGRAHQACRGVRLSTYVRKARRATRRIPYKTKHLAPSLHHPRTSLAPALHQTCTCSTSVRSNPLPSL